jgi:hypothetical protein
MSMYVCDVPYDAVKCGKNVSYFSFMGDVAFCVICVNGERGVFEEWNEYLKVMEILTKKLYE